MSLADFPRLSFEEQQAILQSAALEPPPNTVSNFDSPPNGNAQGLFAVVFCVLLTTLAGFMRIRSRFILKTVHIEDYLGILAYLAFLGCAGCLFAIYHLSGFYVHQWNIRLGTYLDIAEVLIIFTICYCLTMTFSKPAILLEWIRIFVPHHERNAFYWTAWALIVINVALYISSCIATIFNCTPPNKSWKPWVEGFCSDRRALDVGMGFFNLAMDVFILVLPQRVIWRLQMTKARRIGVTVVFSVGVLACGCAVGRLYFNWIAEYSGQGDTTYTVSALFLWGYAELACVLLVFFVPCIPKAVGDERLHKIASLWSSLTTSNKSSSTSNKTRTWPRTIGSISTRSRAYRTMAHSERSMMSSSELELGDNTTAYGHGKDRGAGINVEVAFSRSSESAADTWKYPAT
ncbi:hypothetical protein F4811DRAFT_562889 [Daldinia bambusicola]|nr:hypothetical protein F4811DRAFT_562889 [Daldinia bambusicola]